MKYFITSNEAAKMLRGYNETLQSILDREYLTKEFNCSLGEDPKSVRPEYNYAETQAAINELESKIVSLKHQINVFNLSTVVPELNTTIDQLLIRIPMLTKKKNKLGNMASKLPKQRADEKYGRQTTLVDYTYLNYDLEKVEKDYKEVSEELAAAQTALDMVNNTLKFNVEI